MQCSVFYLRRIGPFQTLPREGRQVPLGGGAGGKRRGRTQHGAPAPHGRTQAHAAKLCVHR